MNKISSLIFIGLPLIILLIVIAFRYWHPNTESQLTKIADAYENKLFESKPEIGILWGRVDVPHDRFRDHSLKAEYEWQKYEDETLTSLQKLNADNLQGTPSAITYQLLKESLENSQNERVCKEWLGWTG